MKLLRETMIKDYAPLSQLQRLEQIVAELQRQIEQMKRDISHKEDK